MAERSSRPGTSTGTTTTGMTPPESLTTGESSRSAADVVRASKDEAMGEAKALMREAADKQRTRAADRLGGMAKALHKSAKDLEGESSTMAQYTDMAASRLEEAARYLSQADWNEIRREAEGFARRQPYWFIGGAVAVGFMAARFLKSSGGIEELRAGSTGRGGSTYAPTPTTGAGYGSSAGYGTTTTVPGYGSDTASTPYGTTATSTPPGTGRTGGAT